MTFRVLCAMLSGSIACAQLRDPRLPEPLTNFRFVDVAATAGISGSLWSNLSGYGAGATAVDYDDDGDIDIFVPTNLGTPDRLYRNNGDGTFTDIAAQVGVASTEQHRMALWFDYDDDGDLDLLVAGDCFRANCNGVSALRLYRQENPGHFTDVTAAAGLSGLVALNNGGHAGGLAAGDIDTDGDLDLFVASWKYPSYLLLNNGDGTFSNVGPASGVNINMQLWQPVMWDFNRDGWLDIFLAIDFRPNKLMLNNHNGTFSEVAGSAGVNYDGNDMGVALGDYDNDGDFDMYVTNIYKNGDHNVLYRMDSVDGAGVPHFAEVSFAAGVADGQWGWGTTFIDANHDGWLDLAETNGANDEWAQDVSRFFLNRGGANPTFADVASTTGADDTYWGSALLALDYDRDGDLDLLQTCYANGPVRLLRNDPVGARPRHWLTIVPRQTGKNKYAVGATVRVTAGTLTMSRPLMCGISFMGQEPYEAVFGIPMGTTAVDVAVIWPDGAETQLVGVPPDQMIEVTR